MAIVPAMLAIAAEAKAHTERLQAYYDRLLAEQTRRQREAFEAWLEAHKPKKRRKSDRDVAYEFGQIFPGGASSGGRGGNQDDIGYTGDPD